MSETVRLNKKGTPSKRREVARLPAAKRASSRTSYDPSHDLLAFRLALLGHTMEDMASVIGVNADTIYEWIKVHPSFAKSLNEGRDRADGDVAASLYRRAMGAVVRETDIRVIEGQIVQTELEREYPPDSTAAIFWLKNRKPAAWRDKQDVVHQNPDGSSISFSVNFVTPDKA